MSRNFAQKPLTVTGILRDTGDLVPGLVIHSADQVRDFLLPGPRVTDGVVVESGWSDLICSECGDTARWCPDLNSVLPAETR